MANRAEQQAAYVLHSRPYRDTSLLVDLFTLEHGKVSVVVQGARRPNSRLRASIQPFVPLHLGWRGRNDLKTLTQAEPVAAMLFLQGDALLCGLYVNELLARLLQPFDAHPRLYVYYQYVLNELLAGDDIEGALRTFEHRMLDELGHLPDLNNKKDDQVYHFSAEHGFSEVRSMLDTEKKYYFYGWQLNAIADDRYDEQMVKRAAKRLMRQAIDFHLGYKPLQSRELFKKM